MVSLSFICILAIYILSSSYLTLPLTTTICFSLSKLFPLRSFPRIEGPDAERDSALFTDGKVYGYFGCCFRNVAVLKRGLRDPDEAFCWDCCLFIFSAIFVKFLNSSFSLCFLSRSSDNYFIKVLFSIVALRRSYSLFTIPWVVLSLTSTI